MVDVRELETAGNECVAHVASTMYDPNMSDRLLPICEYMMFVYRPIVIKGDPNNRDGSDHVVFRSKNPFPVPHVGDEINREATFNEHLGLTKRAIVTRVTHSIQESFNELTCTISVYTKEE